MMTSDKIKLPINIYENESFGRVRIILIDGAPWFVAKDVCDSLGLSDARRAVERLEEDEWSLTTVIDSIGRRQESFP